MLRIKTVNVIARECNFELTIFQYKLLIEVQHEINSMYEYDELETLSAMVKHAKRTPVGQAPTDELSVNQRLENWSTLKKSLTVTSCSISTASQTICLMTAGLGF